MSTKSYQNLLKLIAWPTIKVIPSTKSRKIGLTSTDPKLRISLVRY